MVRIGDVFEVCCEFTPHPFDTLGYRSFFNLLNESRWDRYLALSMQFDNVNRD